MTRSTPIPDDLPVVKALKAAHRAVQLAQAAQDRAETDRLAQVALLVEGYHPEPVPVRQLARLLDVSNYVAQDLLLKASGKGRRERPAQRIARQRREQRAKEVSQ